jgi:hypothetical protein
VPWVPSTGRKSISNLRWNEGHPTNERQRMEASAPPHDRIAVAGNGDGRPTLATDPLRRLDQELAERERTDGTRLHEETRRLLDEGWSIFTECLVIRDGLLQACDEIERTMTALRGRLAGLRAAAGEPHDRTPPAGADLTGVVAASAATDRSTLASALSAMRSSNGSASDDFNVGASKGSNGSAGNGSNGSAANGSGGANVP